MPAPHPAALSDFHLQSAAPNHKFTTPHELLPLQKSQTSEQHLLYADMLPYNTKDLSVTEHGELVCLLEQAVAARPAGCSPRGLEMRRRRRRAGGDAGELAPAPAKRAAAMGIAAPAGGRRCGPARADPGHARGCGGDCGAGGRTTTARVVAGLVGSVFCSRASVGCSMLGHKNIAAGPDWP